MSVAAARRHFDKGSMAGLRYGQGRVSEIRATGRRVAHFTETHPVALKSTRFSSSRSRSKTAWSACADLPATPRVRELRMKALAYERAVRACVITPPTEEQRAAMVKLVLEMNVEVMGLSKKA